MGSPEIPWSHFGSDDEGGGPPDLGGFPEDDGDAEVCCAADWGDGEAGAHATEPGGLPHGETEPLEGAGGAFAASTAVPLLRPPPGGFPDGVGELVSAALAGSAELPPPPPARAPAASGASPRARVEAATTGGVGAPGAEAGAVLGEAEYLEALELRLATEQRKQRQPPSAFGRSQGTLLLPAPRAPRAPRAPPALFVPRAPRCPSPARSSLPPRPARASPCPRRRASAPPAPRRRRQCASCNARAGGRPLR